MNRVLVRSSSHFKVLTVLREGGFLSEVGLDPTFELWEDADEAEAQLFSGTADMISGCHHTPYLNFDDGKPMVYLAQTTIETQEHVVTRQPIASLGELRGRSIALPPLFQPGSRRFQPGEGHPRANRQLMLERAGIGENDIEFVGYGPERASSKERLVSVANEFADGAFVTDDGLVEASDRGLSVLTLEPLPMVLGVTVTTTWEKIEEHAADRDYERFVLALYRAVRFFKSNREGTIKLLEANADALDFSDNDEIVRSYERTSRELAANLTPTAEAIQNAFRLAQYERPDIGERVNPLALWDLHFVHAAAAHERK